MRTSSAERICKRIGGYLVCVLIDDLAWPLRHKHFDHDAVRLKDTLTLAHPAYMLARPGIGQILHRPATHIRIHRRARLMA